MNVTSTLTSVTLYREGAVCIRRATVQPTPEGDPAELRLVGLPLSIAPGSLRARVVKGPAELRVLDVRPAFDVQLAEELDAPAEAKALEAARAETSRLGTLVARIDNEIAELESLQPQFLEQKKGAPPREAPVSTMIGLCDFVDARLEQRQARRRTLWRELEESNEQVRLRERRLAESSSARRTERARLSRCAVVSLFSATREPLELSLEYQVAGARWVPNYQLRLDRGFSGGAFKMCASIAQASGEDWTGVQLSLSTASLSRRTDVPELKALKIGRTQPEPPRPGWRAPPPGLDALFERYDEAMRCAPASGGGLPAAGLARVGATPAHKDQAGRSGPTTQSLEKAGLPRDDAGEVRLEKAKKQAPKRGVARGPQGNRPPPAPAQATSGPAPAPVMAAPPMAKSAGFLAGVGAAVNRAVLARDRRGDDLEDEAAAAEAADAPSEPVTGRFAALSAGGDLEIAVETERLDYQRLVLRGAQESSRGRLQAASPRELMFAASIDVQVDVVMRLVSAAAQRAASVLGLSLPSSCRPVSSFGFFDYRYDCAGRVDVPSTGSWVTVPVMDCSVSLTPEYLCVPSVEPKVYRTLLIKNTTRHGLLAGPVDVWAGDEFLLTTELPAIPPGADTQRIGLGVEEAIKVARKTQFKESSGGLLGGSTVLGHEIEIEVNNRLGTPAKIEVRERVPFPDPSEKDVKFEETQVSPPWEKIDEPLDGEVVHGLRRWKLSAPAGQKLTLVAQFNVRIPADKMLVGGNRRV
jgi:hypothetical protein